MPTFLSKGVPCWDNRFNLQESSTNNWNSHCKFWMLHPLFCEHLKSKCLDVDAIGGNEPGNSLGVLEACNIHATILVLWFLWFSALERIERWVARTVEKYIVLADVWQHQHVICLIYFPIYATGIHLKMFETYVKNMFIDICVFFQSPSCPLPIPRRWPSGCTGWERHWQCGSRSTLASEGGCELATSGTLRMGPKRVHTQKQHTYSI